MSVFVYAEQINKEYKKTTFEAISYAKQIADKLETEVVAIAINSTNVEKLYQYGVSKIIKIIDEGLRSFNVNAYVKIITQVSTGNVIVFPHTANTSAIAPMVAVAKGYSFISGVLESPQSFKPFEVKKKVFSGKGFMVARANSDGVVLTISPNVFGIKENFVQGEEEVLEFSTNSENYNIVAHEPSEGKMDLKEAEIVVAAGRGIREIEDWKLIENLAEVLGGAVACSKPVADNAIRPHSEHVGQTGKVISPNLYIAVGISGAIQHLAGVNGSKTIVVINNDEDAPFFKVADYGVVGDATKIIPMLIEKIKDFKE